MSNVSHLKGAYCHGLLHLIILISWTLLGNEYSDSPRLKACLLYTSDAADE